MIDDVFTSLPDYFVSGVATGRLTFYFSLEGKKKTVFVNPESCSVSDGRTVENADCVCKTSPDFFLKIWHEDYRPSVKDFLSGKIKSNDPTALQTFLKCFGKQL